MDKVTITVDRKVAQHLLGDCPEMIDYFVRQLSSTEGMAHERMQEYLDAWIDAQQKLERVLND